MGIIENLQAELQALRQELNAVKATIKKQNRTAGDKHALAAYIGKSASWVEKNGHRFPRYKVGKSWWYNFAEVDRCLREESERIDTDW